MATKPFFVKVLGGYLVGEVFKEENLLKVEPRRKLVSGCLACLRVGHVGNQHTWKRHVGRYFVSKRGHRTFRLLDRDRTILNLEKGIRDAKARGERVDVFPIPFFITEIPHARIWHQTWIERDGRLLEGNFGEEEHYFHPREEAA